MMITKVTMPGTHVVFVHLYSLVQHTGQHHCFNFLLPYTASNKWRIRTHVLKYSVVYCFVVNDFSIELNWWLSWPTSYWDLPTQLSGCKIILERCKVILTLRRQPTVRSERRCLRWRHLWRRHRYKCQHLQDL